MSFEDKRNILRIGPPEHPGETEITPAMVESVRQRIKDAGGILTVWAVLHEDVYETQFGDGFYLHVRGLALNSADAHRLAALGGGDSEFAKWHVRSYRLGLKDNAPFFTALWRPEEEFRISQFVAILCEIPPGGTASKLLYGNGPSQGRPAAVASLEHKSGAADQRVSRAVADVGDQSSSVTSSSDSGSSSVCGGRVRIDGGKQHRLGQPLAAPSSAPGSAPPLPSRSGNAGSGNSRGRPSCRTTPDPCPRRSRNRRRWRQAGRGCAWQRTRRRGASGCACPRSRSRATRLNRLSLASSRLAIVLPEGQAQSAGSQLLKVVIAQTPHRFVQGEFVGIRRRETASTSRLILPRWRSRARPANCRACAFKDAVGALRFGSPSPSLGSPRAG